MFQRSRNLFGAASYAIGVLQLRNLSSCDVDSSSSAAAAEASGVRKNRMAANGTDPFDCAKPACSDTMDLFRQMKINKTHQKKEIKKVDPPRDSEAVTPTEATTTATLTATSTPSMTVTTTITTTITEPQKQEDDGDEEEGEEIGRASCRERV